MTHFNQMANTWDTQEKINQNKVYSEKIKANLKNKDFQNVLEIGCGTGLLGSHFITQQNHYLGVDTSPGMLEVFNQKFKNYPNVRSAHLNLEEQENNLLENPFDLILSSMAFHHLIDPEKVLFKLKRLLNPDGMIAIIDLDEEPGNFHPDSKNMGVHHFGFSQLTTTIWAENLHFKKYSREIINVIKKDSGEFPVFLVTYLN